jgi:N-methylhydantoinase B/oxoprolinase/acetone carboxylase alpha subunit
MAATVIDFVPIIDDLPITTLSVLFIIWNSRKTDKKQNDAAAKVAASTKHTNQVQYEIRERAAQNAVANANAMRQQAMDVSRSKITPPPQAANDTYPTAANFSTDEEFPEAA